MTNSDKKGDRKWGEIRVARPPDLLAAIGC